MPDMRLPIQYAFSYPDRISSSFDRLDFSQCTNLTFEQPDTKRFRNLAFAYEAMYRGGNMPCIVNAANEVVVASFLKDGISFLGMSDVIEQTMERVAFIAESDIRRLCSYGCGSKENSSQSDMIRFIPLMNKENKEID